MAASPSASASPSNVAQESQAGHVRVHTPHSGFGGHRASGCPGLLKSRFRSRIVRVARVTSHNAVMSSRPRPATRFPLHPRSAAGLPRFLRASSDHRQAGHAFRRDNRAPARLRSLVSQPRRGARAHRRWTCCAVRGSVQSPDRDWASPRRPGSPRSPDRWMAVARRAIQLARASRSPALRSAVVRGPPFGVPRSTPASTLPDRAGLGETHDTASPADARRRRPRPACS
jgi:hypothetical protein